MSNQVIIDVLELTAKLLDLHDGEEIRVKTYQSAAYNLDRFAGRLENLDFGQLIQLQGIGKLTAGKIIEVLETGSTKELNELLAKTPIGLLEIFKIKGLGVKKIKTLWKETGIDSIDLLKIACEKGEIAQLKGFGGKIQASVLESIEFVLAQKGKVRMDVAEEMYEIISKALKPTFLNLEIVGQQARLCEVVSLFQFVAIGSTYGLDATLFIQDIKKSSPNRWFGHYSGIEIPIEIFTVSEQNFEAKVFELTASEDHLASRNEAEKSLLEILKSSPNINSEGIYKNFGSKFIVPEMRENAFAFDWIKNNENEDLISDGQLKGIIHNHSTYSDGKNTLEEMAVNCRDLGYQYLGISDHSQSLSVANGLLPTKVLEQQSEIDALNFKLAPFKILKGIESDILSDGSLDYEPEILKTFDFIVASVHQNLTMNLDHATERVIRAVENPHTTILGHPTGRLLLSRMGYPLDFQKVIDACAANHVSIELNASPWRLDLDWRYIDYCMKKGVMISINPDAHDTAGYHDMKYGVKVARKGGLTTKMTLNALSLSEIETVFNKKKS
jgi:DNA polymerase (family X)